MDTHSTSVIGFKGNDFVVFGTDSRAVHFRYGNVTNDDILKIHRVCDNVFGTGAGSGGMVRSVFKKARKDCLSNRPNNVKEAADCVSTIAKRKAKSYQRSPADFMVAGWITGGCEMYTIMPSTETKGSKTAVKRKDKEPKQKYQYKVKEVDKVFLGSGTKAMTEYLSGNEYHKYPLTASASLEEAKEVMKDAMRIARYYDFGTDGKLRVLSVSEGGGVRCSTVEPIRARPDAAFGDWIEDEFTPVADVVDR